MKVLRQNDSRLVRVRLVILVLATALPVLMLAAVWVQPFTEPSNLLRDPLAVAEGFQNAGWPCCSNLLGAISTIGVMVWAATAAVSALAALVLWMRRDPTGPVWFLVTGAVFSLWLALDDGLMLHETYKLGKVAGLSLFAWSLIIFTLLLVAQVRSVWHAGGTAMLAIALGALALSWLVDKYVGHFGMLEDALKVFGIFYWAGFFSTVSLTLLMSRV